MTIEVRTARVGDRDAILAVVLAAFSNRGHDGQEEVDIVRETWARGAAVDDLELVAVDGDAVVGHVLGARGVLAGREVVGIAPLCVAPDRHRTGVGRALMTEVLSRAERAGLPFVVLLGDPAYYGRFGFEAAGPFGIHYPPVGTGDPHFMVRRFAGFDPSYRGDYVYCWEMNASAHERCTQCGFDGGVYDDAGLVDAVRALGPRWRALLDSAGSELRTRPEPEVWSAIEYAAHSRDITALHVYGVEQALTGDEPVLPEIQDDLVESVASTYADADPAAVADRIEAESARLAGAADAAGSGAWSRGITIGTNRIDVRALLEHALHDSLHHVQDVERGFVALRM